MNKIFETERLQARDLDADDLDAFHDLQCNPAVMRYITGRAMTIQESSLAFEKYLHKYKDPENVFRVWAIERKQDSAFIGTCALITMEGTIENDLGYRLRQQYWGHGYGGEIADGLIKYAFQDLKLPFLVADADKENTASIRILERTMHFVEEVHYPDEGCTALKYELQKEDYNSD